MAIVHTNPSLRLAEDMQDAESMPLYTEKSKSEIIIYPIITVFSGYSLNIEGHKELQGNPDFLISAKQGIAEPRSPIFCLFESKNKAPEEVSYSLLLMNIKNKGLSGIFYGLTNHFDEVTIPKEYNILL